MIQSFVDLYAPPNILDFTAVGNTATETVLCDDLTIFGTNRQMQPSMALSYDLRGRISNVVTAAPTIRFRVRWGGVAGLVLADSGAIACSASAFTNAQWAIYGSLIIRAFGSGTSGSIMCQGEVFASNFGTLASILMGSAGVLTPAVVGVDTTVDKALSFTAQWGTANASNTIQCITAMVLSLR